MFQLLGFPLDYVLSPMGYSDKRFVPSLREVGYSQFGISAEMIIIAQFAQLPAAFLASRIRPLLRSCRSPMCISHQCCHLVNFYPYMIHILSVSLCSLSRLYLFMY